MEYFNLNTTDWRISQCCKFHDKRLAKRYNLGTTTKATASKPGGREKVQQKALDNCDKLVDLFASYFPQQPIHLRSFRISSELFPCYTLDFTKEWYEEIWDVLSYKLKTAGDLAKKHRIRTSTHPGQYTVLGSISSDVVKNSVRDLEYHAQYGKLMGLEPEDFVINIHLQGLYGGKREDGITRFATNFQYLSDYAQRALAVENEDKPNGYDIEHTLELAKHIPIRCTLDTHHYSCHRMTEVEKVRYGNTTYNRKSTDVDRITVNSDFFKEAVKTWKGIRPLFHVSQSFPDSVPEYWMKRNAHCEVFWNEELMAEHIPMLEYADFDIEAKNKEQAVQHFYKFILAEEKLAGEPLVCKTL